MGHAERRRKPWLWPGIMKKEGIAAELVMRVRGSRAKRNKINSIFIAGLAHDLII
jgi:hypothetical protein